jgi:hypothetical protein
MITAFFGFMWFALTGLCFSLPFVAKATHIPTTRICIVTRFASFGSVSVIAHVIYDTLVFVSISLRIISFSMAGDTFTARMRSFFRGDGVPILSKSVLHGGQLYYMSVISCPYARHSLIFPSSPAMSLDIILISLMLAPVPLVYRYMFVNLHLAIDSAMACRVFRGVKLGYIKETDDRAPSFSSRNPTAVVAPLEESQYKMHSHELSSRSFTIDIPKTVRSGEY